MDLDLASIEEQLELGRRFKIKYRYPREEFAGQKGPPCGMRSDRLVDVSIELRRFYTLFRGATPIWLEEEEIIELVPDDGIYEEFSEE